MKKNNTARGLAAASLVSFGKKGRYSNLEVDSTLRRAGASLSPTDSGLYTRLVYGVVERKITIDSIVKEFSSRRLGNIDDETLTALRIGIYQLLYMDKVPDFAAVSEAVDLAPPRSRGFVNGVLRSFLRAGKNFSLPDADSRGREYISVKYSVSPEIFDILANSWGSGTAEQILASSFDEGHVALKVNTLRITVNEAEALLDDWIASEAKAGETDDSYGCISGAMTERIYKAKRSKLCPDVLLVPSLTKAARRGIARGLWFVQDESSRAATVVLGARAGERIADVCAAPGGKSFSAAIDMENSGEIFSFDLHRSKLSLIRDGADRLGLNIITAAERDAGHPDEALAGACDRVLCDAPCSGLGVLSKKPEIRYKDTQSIARLPKVQLRALAGAASYVKKGGVLVYSTCTLNKCENEDVVRRFITENPSFVPEDFAVGKLQSEDGMLTLLPHVSGSDGFFIARMRLNT